jgi:ech hydrogenase subunit F
MELLSNILRNTFAKPVTRLYPKETRDPFAGARGHLEMNPETCTFCGVCEKRCPTGAITVVRKPSKSWTLRPHQCILCGYCIEVCPKDCLSMDENHRPPSA